MLYALESPQPARPIERKTSNALRNQPPGNRVVSAFNLLSGMILRNAFRSAPGFAPRASGLCRLLLGEAVQSAKSPNEIDGMNSHDFPSRESIRNCGQRGGIRRIVERRHDHYAVGDVKIGIAGGQPLSVH